MIWGDQPCEKLDPSFPNLKNPDVIALHYKRMNTASEYFQPEDLGAVADINGHQETCRNQAHQKPEMAQRALPFGIGICSASEFHSTIPKAKGID